MADLPVVSVRGEAHEEAEPEIATVTFTVQTRDSERSELLRRLTESFDQVRSALDEHAQAIDKRSTSDVSIYPVIKRGGKVTGYAGQIATAVTVSDFAAIGPMMVRLATFDNVQISGPWWELRPDSPAYKATRHAAIDDAMTRAADYAQALGARVVRLIQLADAGMQSKPVSRTAMLSAASSLEMGRDDSSLVFDLEPARQHVYASIEATFEISEPTALPTSAR